MQLNVLFNGKALTISAQSTDTLATLKAAVAAQDPLLTPTTVTLEMGGAALCPAQPSDADTSITLASLGITDGVTLNATLTPTMAPTEAAAPAAVKKSKVRCNHPGGCKDKVNKLIGHCQFCDTLFCSRHRIPESHACESIDSCRKASFDRNSDKLLGQKCVAQKV